MVWLRHPMKGPCRTARIKTSQVNVLAHACMRFFTINDHGEPKETSIGGAP
jgi:hypothetical protein